MGAVTSDRQKVQAPSDGAVRPGGGHRVRLAALFDAEVRRHNERFRAAAAVGARDRVLDIGCGTGESTRDAARVAAAVLGVDLSAEALDHARRLSEGLGNVTYERADAQVHPFPPDHFDLGISRFGTMFFADPAAAFTNVGRALRAGARLVLLVWQGGDRNEWSFAVRRALGAGPAVPAAPSSPFSLGDPAVVEGVLAASGFGEAGFTDVHEPVYYGPDVATAYDLVLGLRDTQELLAGLDPAATERALERLRATLAEHETGDGVYFDSRAWIITARRR
jgi:SAM-dependent methyltransferase